MAESIYGERVHGTLEWVRVDSSSGSITIKAPTASQKVRVVALNLVASAGVTLQFKGLTTKLTGDASVTTWDLPFSPVGWFETAAGKSLILEQGGSADIDGLVIIQVLDA